MELDLRELETLRTMRDQRPELRVAIEKTAMAAGFALMPGQIILQNPERMRVTLPAASASQTFRWMAMLQSASNMRLEGARVTSLDHEEQVRVEAVVATAR
jgi:type II secretory pathway component PulM